MNKIYKRFEELDVCGKVIFKSKLREFAFPDENSMCPPPSKVHTKGARKKLIKRSQRSTKHDPSYWKYVDAYHSVQNSNTSGFIEDVVDVKADGNCGYHSVAALLDMGEESWAVMHNELIKELGKWSQYYIKLLGGTERFEQLRLSLHVDGLSKVSVDKWMDITEMRYVIASRYNVILVSLHDNKASHLFLSEVNHCPILLRIA
ncbi:hypothetical protein GmHk_03G007568 [Glycine max]|nr:hypothetical protein GmHk_03G007568 [Glycine max]